MSPRANRAVIVFVVHSDDGDRYDWRAMGQALPRGAIPLEVRWEVNDGATDRVSLHGHDGSADAAAIAAAGNEGAERVFGEARIAPVLDELRDHLDDPQAEIVATFPLWDLLGPGLVLARDAQSAGRWNHLVSTCGRIIDAGSRPDPTGGLEADLDEVGNEYVGGLIQCAAAVLGETGADDLRILRDRPRQIIAVWDHRRALISLALSGCSIGTVASPMSCEEFERLLAAAEETVR